MTNKSTLDRIERLDQVATNQWHALAGILGKSVGRDPVDAVKLILRGKTSISIEILARLGDLNKGVIMSKRSEKFAPRVVFRHGKKRHVTQNFHDLILPLAKPLSPATSSVVTYYEDIECDMEESWIAEEYPARVYRTASSLLTHVDYLTALQPNGKSCGDLLTENHDPNAFILVPDENNPIEGFVIKVYWGFKRGLKSRRWIFDAHPLGRFMLSTGTRIFSAKAIGSDNL